jgi:23S rRNA-/tRNA-specific pseudouridylate synthase
LIARNSRIIREVHNQMAQGTAQKTYLALVRDTNLRDELRKLSPSGLFPSDPMHPARQGEIDERLVIDDSVAVRLAKTLPKSMSVGEVSKLKLRDARTKWEWLACSVSMAQSPSIDGSNS